MYIQEGIEIGGDLSTRYDGGLCGSQLTKHCAFAGESVCESVMNL